MKARATQISFNSALLLGINGIIGSGIFLLPGTLYKEAGNLSVLAIMLAGLSTLLIALNYAVMASKIDDDGGAWTYANRAFGSLAGFQTGWFGWFLGVITIAAEIAALLTTLGGFVPAFSHPLTYKVTALALIVALGVLNLFGATFVKYLDNLSSVLKISILVIFIGSGAILLWHGQPTSAATVAPHPHFTSAFTTAFYMFTGFSFLPNVAGQLKNAARALPRVMILAMVAVTLIYGATQAVTIAFLHGSLAGESLPVAAAFAQIAGEVGRVVILSGMLISIIGVAIAVSFATPVELASMATKHESMPTWFARQNRFGVAYIAVLATTGLAAALVVSGEYIFLVKLIVFSSFIQYVATIGAVLKLRHDTTLSPGLRLPGGMLVPIASLVLIGYLLTSFAPVTFAIGAGFAMVGMVVYWVEQHRTSN